MRRIVVTSILTSLLTIASGLVGAARARADAEVSLRMTGITVIGEYASRNWAVTWSLLGCTWRSLGDAPSSEPYIVHGTDGDDTIRVIQAPVLWCNRILQPVTQNGHAIQIHGGAGDDEIYGGGSAPFSGNPNTIYGDDGDDTLYAGPGGARAEGGPGNDVVYGGDSPGDQLLGGPGNDVLCEQPEIQPLIQDGGDDEDVSCSPGAANEYVGIERVDCSACDGDY